ncbi:MAG TPA: YHS domain-containing (seleno)protein [Bauldia sp.]|nr:YHS domain-containing (seleno)protein [Bauldia sp.]
MKPINLLQAAGFATVMLGAIALGQASAAEVNTGYFGNVAIEGYDAVAYFTLGKATKGSDTFTRDWGGATWYFASAENRDRFAANPEAYAPQFGGLCAEGVAFHEVTVNIEPEVFAIVDGKLYFTAATAFADLPGNLPNAVKNWPEVHGVLVQ